MDLFWKYPASNLHKPILKRVKCHHKLYLALRIFPVYCIPYVDVFSLHMGRKSLDCSKQSSLLNHQLKHGTPAGWSSTYELQQLMRQGKFVHDHGSKQELKRTNVLAFIHWEPDKDRNLEARFWMGGDGGIHWPTVESDGRKHPTSILIMYFWKSMKFLLPPGTFTSQCPFG